MGSLHPNIFSPWQRPSLCSAGIDATVIAQTAEHPACPSTEGGGATVQRATRSTFRGPIPSSSCSRLRASVACLGARTALFPACGRVLPDSWSRGRRSRKQYGARPAKKPASSLGGYVISLLSLGHFRAR